MTAAAKEFFEQFEEGGKFEGETDTVVYLSSRHNQNMDLSLKSIEVREYENDNDARFGENYVQFHFNVDAVRDGQGYEKLDDDILNPDIEEGDTVTLQFSLAKAQTKFQAKNNLKGLQQVFAAVSGQSFKDVRNKGIDILDEMSDPEAFAGAKMRLTTPEDKQREKKGVTYFNPAYEAL